MVRRKKEREMRMADLRAEDMRAALPRLRNRIEELRAVNIKAIQNRRDPHLRALEQKVNSTLSDIFGHDTVEYQEFGDVYLDRASMNMMYETPLHEVQQGFTRGIATVISTLETIISLFQEKLGDEKHETTNRARLAFSQLDLHQ